MRSHRDRARPPGGPSRAFARSSRPRKYAKSFSAPLRLLWPPSENLPDARPLPIVRLLPRDPRLNLSAIPAEETSATFANPKALLSATTPIAGIRRRFQPRRKSLTALRNRFTKKRRRLARVQNGLSRLQSRFSSLQSRLRKFDAGFRRRKSLFRTCKTGLPKFSGSFRKCKASSQSRKAGFRVYKPRCRNSKPVSTPSKAVS